VGYVYYVHADGKKELLLDTCLEIAITTITHHLSRAHGHP